MNTLKKSRAIEFIPDSDYATRDLREKQLKLAQLELHDPKIVLQMIKERNHLPVVPRDYESADDEGWMVVAAGPERYLDEDQKAEIRRKKRIIEAINACQEERIRLAELNLRKAQTGSAINLASSGENSDSNLA